jgi:hypothetical protein
VLALVAAGALAAGCGASGRTATSIPPAGAHAITVVARHHLDARTEDWTLRTPALGAPTHVRVLLRAGCGCTNHRLVVHTAAPAGANGAPRGRSRRWSAHRLGARDRPILPR